MAAQLCQKLMAQGHSHLMWFKGGKEVAQVTGPWEGLILGCPEALCDPGDRVVPAQFCKNPISQRHCDIPLPWRHLSHQGHSQDITASELIPSGS